MRQTELLEITEVPAVTPGYRTTEFWLSLAAIVVSAVMAGSLVTSDRWTQILMVVATVLSSLGYTGSRAVVKSAQLLASANAVERVAVVPAKPDAQGG